MPYGLRTLPGICTGRRGPDLLSNSYPHTHPPLTTTHLKGVISAGLDQKINIIDLARGEAAVQMEITPDRGNDARSIYSVAVDSHLRLVAAGCTLPPNGASYAESDRAHWTCRLAR